MVCVLDYSNIHTARL